MNTPHENQDAILPCKETCILKYTLLFIVTTTYSLLGTYNYQITLDDAYVYYTVVNNYVSGSGPVLNGGDSHFVLTSPLWFIILSITRYVPGIVSIDIVSIAKFLYFSILGLASITLFLSLQESLKSACVLSPIIIFTGALTLNATGGEIALCFLFISILLYCVKSPDLHLLTGSAAALAYLSRGEMILFLPVVYVAWILKLFIHKECSWAYLIKSIVKSLIPLACIVSLWHTFFFFHFGSIFPDTLHAKLIQGASGDWKLFSSQVVTQIVNLFSATRYFYLFGIFGVAYLNRMLLPILLLTAIQTSVYSLLGVPNYHWYYYTIYYLIPLLILTGIGESSFILASHAFSAFRSKHLSLLLAALTSLSTSIHGSILIGDGKVAVWQAKGESERQITYRKAARWFNANASSDDIILTFEIGILSFYLDKGIVRDVNGLASPNITKHAMNNWRHFVRKYDPEFLFLGMGNKNESNSYCQNGNRIMYPKKLDIDPNARVFKGAIMKRGEILKNSCKKKK